MELLNLSCKCCSAPLDPEKAAGRTIRCEYCGTVFTMAKENEPKLQSFLDQGEHDLDTCKFDDAFEAYRKAAELDDSEPEAHFGMALAAFKIQYLKDEVNNRLQPICHEISDKSILDDKNFRKALSLATDEQKREYKKRGREIDEIKEEFFDLRKRGLSYDCFLCVKVTEEDGKTRTKDYEHANDVYYHLKDKGFRPFFSERELGKATGADYEALILYALYTSECMLIVCSDEEYLQTKWVKNEYTRFFRMLANEEKERDAITFLFSGKPIEKLPNGKKIQGIDLEKPDAYGKITAYVQSHTPEAKKKREEEARRKEEEAARREEEERRFREEQKREQREFQREILKQMRAAPSAEQSGRGATVDSLLIRAEQERKDGQFDKAKGYYDRVLEADPVNGEAWLGTFLCSRGATDETVLLNELDAELYRQILDDRYFRNAQRYAIGETKERVEKFSAALDEGEAWWRIFLNERGVKEGEELLRGLNAERAKQIEQDARFVYAEKRADGPLKKTIAAFRKNVLRNPAAYWNAFLEDFGAKNESEIECTLEALSKISSDPNYLLASEYADEAFRPRLDAFRARMKESAEQIAKAKEAELNGAYPGELRAEIEKAKEEMRRADEEAESTKLMRKEWRKIREDGGGGLALAELALMVVLIASFEVLFNVFVGGSIAMKCAVSLFGGVVLFFFSGQLMIWIDRAYYGPKKKVLAEKYRLPISELSDEALKLVKDPKNPKEKIFKSEPAAVARSQAAQEKLSELETQFETASARFLALCEEYILCRRAERLLSGTPVAAGENAEWLPQNLRERYLALKEGN